MRTAEQIHNDTIDLVTRALRAGARFTNVEARRHVRLDMAMEHPRLRDDTQVIVITMRMPPGADLWDHRFDGCGVRGEELKQADVEVVDGDALKRIEG